MKKLLFIDGTKSFYPSRIKEKPTGGISTSLTIIPRLLAQYGYDVTVASAWEGEEVIDNVRYTQNALEQKCDVLISNRNTLNRGMLDFYKAKTIWWLHDIVDHRYLEDDAFKYVDKIVALSRYCKESYRDFYDIPYNKFVVIPNGVDKKVFYADDRKRNKNLYIMASDPIKGIVPVEFIWANLKRNFPDMELRMYIGEDLHEIKHREGQKKAIQILKEAGVNVLNPIPQEELAEVMREAWCLLMPNSYPEICSQLLIQSQACHLPVISSPIGSVPEYIYPGRGGGILTKRYPHDLFWWWKELALNACRIQDEKLHDRLSLLSYPVPEWTEIASQWNNLIKEL